MYYVQIVGTNRCYGGPEEGGWYYNHNVVHFSKRTTKRLAKKLAKQMAAEITDDFTDGEVSLVTPGWYEVIRPAYRGRDIYSVLGDTDYTIQVCRTPTETTRERPRYE
mgnify:CR=1 FL=1